MPKIKEDAPTVNTGAIPNPAKTSMGPDTGYRAMTVHDRRRKKNKHPVLLKRFRDYYKDKGIG